jgi:hypothetical protein
LPYMTTIGTKWAFCRPKSDQRVTKSVACTQRLI